jgi:ABC-2 type transport system ATP-binding protein
MTRRSGPPPAIVVTDLRKTYGRLQALQGISFTVQPGEIFGLIGPDGAWQVIIESLRLAFDR